MCKKPAVAVRYRIWLRSYTTSRISYRESFSLSCTDIFQIIRKSILSQKPHNSFVKIIVVKSTRPYCDLPIIQYWTREGITACNRPSVDFRALPHNEWVDLFCPLKSRERRTGLPNEKDAAEDQEQEVPVRKEHPKKQQEWGWTRRNTG